MTNEKFKAYRLMSKNFRSANFSSKDTTEEFKANPEFKEWYFKNYIGLKNGEVYEKNTLSFTN